MRIRRIITKAAVAATAVAAIAGLGTIAATTAASAAPSITGSTSVTNHPDTTNVSGPACTSSPGGPVWADDFYTSTITATQAASPANTWDIAISDSGKYVAFADPTTCKAQLSTGSLTGTYDLTVTSATPPSAAGLKSDYDGAVSTSTMVADFFGGKATNIAGGAYDFSYQGGNYVQTSSKISGDVTPVACTVSVGAIADQHTLLNTAATPVQVTASSNYPDSSLAFAASNLPDGLSISPSGKISGTPDITGTHVVTVKVTNTTSPASSVSCSGTESFNWSVFRARPPRPAGDEIALSYAGGCGQPKADWAWAISGPVSPLGLQFFSNGKAISGVYHENSPLSGVYRTYGKTNVTMVATYANGHFPQHAEAFVPQHCTPILH